MKKYLIPAEEILRETLVVNSRFIASLAPVFSVEQAKEYLSSIREEYSDASHHVPAYIIGHGSSEISHCSDDGEPSGSAGRPALAVLQGSGLGDVIVVVTRYFGGTKLGIGGLVRAYGDAVRIVCAEVKRAERVPGHIVMVGLPYNFLERIRILSHNHMGIILDEDFAGEVTLTIRFPIEYTENFQRDLQEISAGRLHGEIIESTEIIQIVE